MLILAVEHSTAQAGIALLRDSTMVAESTWSDVSQGRRQLLGEITSLLAEEGLELAGIDLFAVGLGPGAYTNLRLSLSTARGLALPGGQPVRGINSALAMARDIARSTGSEKVMIVGDARRSRLWMVKYDAKRDPDNVPEMQLLKPEELQSNLDPGETVATSDWERIGDLLQQLTPASCTLIRESRVPSAVTIGIMAHNATQTSDAEFHPATPLSPIYIHPPVFGPAKVFPFGPCFRK